MLHKAPVPRDLKEYVSIAGDLMAALRKIHPAGINSKPKCPYTLSWLIRSHLYAEMRSRGITLSVHKDVTIKEFSASFPDACSWTEAYAFATSTRAQRVCDVGSVKVIDLVKELQYTHPIEMLTCLFCIFGHEMVLRTSTQYLEAHHEALRAHRIQSNANVELHPSTLLKSYADTQL